MGRLPSLKPRRLVRLLKSHGFEEDHQTGSHLVLRHPTRGVRVVVPMHATDLPRGTVMAILRSAGIEDLRD